MTVNFIASRIPYKYVIHHYDETRDYINDIMNGKPMDDLYTTCLSFLSIGGELLEFAKIRVFYDGVWYDIKLGNNDWCGNKEIREAHNLLKLVRAYILNK